MDKKFSPKFNKADYEELANTLSITKTEAFIQLEAHGLAKLQSYSEDEAKIRLRASKSLRDDM
jgi:hypothetical protein